MSRKTGLTLGKYAPFHAGHQYVIETALAEMDHVIVIIYVAAATTDIPLPVRAGWIRELYPSVEVIEAPDGPEASGDTPEIRSLQENWLQQRLAGRTISAFYSSEFYGQHVSEALGAEDRRLNRQQIPVSATDIRRDPVAMKRWLHPVVYRSHVINVVFLGAPGTGKSTLSEKLATQFNTCVMPEYGREYWQQHQQDRRLSKEQLTELARTHVTREDKLLEQAGKWLFTDTNALSTLQFSLYYHGSATAELEQLARQAEKRYDLFFLCGADIPYENSWDRSGDVYRQWFQNQVEADLRERKITYISLYGSVEARLKRVTAVLSRFRKFRSVADCLLPGDSV